MPILVEFPYLKLRDEMCREGNFRTGPPRPHHHLVVVKRTSSLGNIEARISSEEIIKAGKLFKKTSKRKKIKDIRYLEIKIREENEECR